MVISLAKNKGLLLLNLNVNPLYVKLIGGRIERMACFKADFTPVPLLSFAFLCFPLLSRQYVKLPVVQIALHKEGNAFKRQLRSIPKFCT